MSDIPIKGTPRGTAAQAFETAKRRGAQRLDFLRDYLTALYADAATLGINADVLVGQADLETGAFTSTYWIRDGNPGGLAAFDDGSSWGLTFSPQKAARAQVTHMAAYLGMTMVPPSWLEMDARWNAVIDAGYFGSVTTTDDLGNGRWATDPQYASKLRERYVAYWGEPQAQPSTPPEETPMAKPTIILVAGHRSDGDSGNPNEKDRTDDMARAYLAAFKAAGYVTHYVQNEDGDGRPDITSGGLDTVSAKTRQIMQGISGPMVLLDLHFEGAAARGVFAIVPDVTGLRTAVIGGAPTDDTWANNPLDVKLAGVISRTIAAATGLPIRATTQPGIMSERHTGVGYDGWRLATMAYSAWCRDRAVRLVVEHGSLPTADVSIINQPGFYEKCAAAAVAAVNEVYAVSTPAPQPEPEPEPEPQPGQKHELPKGMTVQLARRLFGQYVAPWDGTVFAFDLDEAPSQVWLARGKRSIDAGKDFQTGVWPELRQIIRRGDGGQVWVWSDGSTYERKAPAQDAA